LKKGDLGGFENQQSERTFGNCYNSFRNSSSWAFGPPVRHEKVVLAGGAAFPGCALITYYFSTGWKACATEIEFLVFSTRFGFKPLDLTKKLMRKAGCASLSRPTGSTGSAPAM
jgi:hypothetical protein